MALIPRQQLPGLGQNAFLLLVLGTQFDLKINGITHGTQVFPVVKNHLAGDEIQVTFSIAEFHGIPKPGFDRGVFFHAFFIGQCCHCLGEQSRGGEFV